MNYPTMVTIPISIDARITPNSREHWRTQRAIQKEMKETAQQAVKAAILPNDPKAAFRDADLPLTMNYVIGWAKGRRYMDDTNAIAALKYIEDGIALALGIDDKYFIIGTVEQTRDPDKVGFVRVLIHAARTGEEGCA